MNKLQLNIDDLSVDTFQAGPVAAASGTVHGQAPTKKCNDLTDNPDICILTNDTGCNVFTDDEPGCPILITDDDPECLGL